MRLLVQVPVHIEILIEADTAEAQMEQWDAAEADLRFSLRHQRYSVGPAEFRDVS